MTAYEISNSIETLPSLNKIKSATKKSFAKLFVATSLTQSQMQSLTDMICKDLGVETRSIAYGGTQPHKLGDTGKLVKKVFGTYRTNAIVFQIKIYKHTAKLGKVVANKTTLDTLLHEICHHLDYKLVRLADSKHTAGFYKRISSLRNELLL